MGISVSFENHEKTWPVQKPKIIHGFWEKIVFSRQISTQTQVRHGELENNVNRKETHTSPELFQFRSLYLRELKVHFVRSKDAFLESVQRAVGNTTAR